MPESTPVTGWMTCDDREWSRAWAQFPDPVLEDPGTGEYLQYMGSRHTSETGWRHTFRHRCHPLTRQRHYWHIPATTEWHP
jgi:hypothetical protein